MDRSDTTYKKSMALASYSLLQYAPVQMLINFVYCNTVMSKLNHYGYNDKVLVHLVKKSIIYYSLEAESKQQNYHLN